MKNKSIIRTLVLLLALILAFAATGCGKKADPTTTKEPTTAAPTTTAPKPILPDVPADRYDATKTARTGNNATNPLVVGLGTMDGKFSPFFATSAYDVDVSDMTQLGLLFYNKDGAPEAGINVPSFAYDFTQEISADNSTSTYTFMLKNKLVFSDGKPMSAKDVLFSMYVLCDPKYDGSSTFYTLNIQGLKEYRLQTNADTLAMVDKIIAAGIKNDDNKEMVINPADGVTPEQQQKFWSYLDAAGEKFAQEIIDYVNTKYTSYIAKYFAPYTAEQVAADDDLKAAFGMVMWGYGEVAEDGKFTDLLGNVYDMTSATVDAKIYWKNLQGNYGYDLTDAGINYEKAGELSIQDYVQAEYIQAEGQVAGGVQNISGITSGKMVCDDGVEREYVKIVINGVDPTAIFKLGVQAAPFHYYTEGYTGQLNANGVDLDKKEFMDHLKTKNIKPVGAGPYMFQEYKDNVVTYTANDSFLLGSPKIKTFRYQELSMGAELDSVLTGTVHYEDPSAATTIINDITAGEGNYSKLDYILVDNDGYGYIGIQGQAIPEFQVRKALAHAMNVQLSVDNYYGELASVNYRTMTKILWAYPDNPDNLFPYDGTGEKSKALFLEAGYKYDAAKNIMSYPDGHAKAGTQVTYKFTIPGAAEKHPAGSIFIDAQEVLAKIGVKVNIETDESLLDKLSTAYESGVEVWAAAWGSGGVDPDMFQIWYSDPAVNQGTSAARSGLYWLFENGSDEEKAMLTELNELIIAGRSTLDTEERKTIYKKALELSTGLAVEVPTYQRKNMYVFNSEVIKASSLFSGEDVTPFQDPINYIWNVELN
ncbi:MAG: ABC transporter substrate-binding protein [Eubacteriales bacterium]|nr:ABC transporter substrate-binding protein [Eubacteriales bacterium]